MSVNAIGYLRVSSLGQVDGDGLTRQRDAIERFAKASGYRVVEWFEDAGISGTTELENRPGLMDAMARIASQRVKVVIVENADRLARHLMVQEAIIAQFAAAGARILTADGFDLTDDEDETRVLIRQVMGAVAEFMKRSIVRRMRVARERERKKHGYCEGRAPYYGYHEAERKVVERMLRLRRARKGYKAIADRLNAEGARTRSGKPWTSRGVFNVLTRWKRLDRFTQPAEAISVVLHDRRRPTK